VLVIAHDQPRLVADQPVIPDDDVGGNLLVRRPEVRAVVDVVNRGGQIVAGHGGLAARCRKLRLY
jgi:hypothetical protein